MPEVQSCCLVAEVSDSLNHASKDTVNFVGEEQQCPLCRSAFVNPCFSVRFVTHSLFVVLLCVAS